MIMPFTYDDFDLSGVKTYPLKSRRSKARVEDFARACGSGATVAAWLDSLPNALAAADLRAVVRAIQQARRTDAGVVWGIGAHVIKTGLGPVLIDLMERGYVSAIAANGATIIHDFEIAIVGATSEDVDEARGPVVLRPFPKPAAIKSLGPWGRNLLSQRIRLGREFSSSGQIGRATLV